MTYCMGACEPPCERCDGEPMGSALSTLTQLEAAENA